MQCYYKKSPLQERLIAGATGNNYRFLPFQDKAREHLADL